MKMTNGLSVVRAPSDDPKSASFTVTIDDLPTYLRAIGQDELAQWAEQNPTTEKDWCGCEQPNLYHCQTCPKREWVGGPMQGDF